MRADFSLFFIRKTNEHQRMMPLLAFQTLKQSWKQRSATPVIYYSAAVGHLIIVRANNDLLLALSRERANDVRCLCAFHLLFSQCFRTSGLFEQRLQCCLPLRIFHLGFMQPSIDLRSV